MSTLIDLDALIGDDVEVLLQGQPYFVPADIPAPTMLRLLKLYEQAGVDGDTPELLEQILEEITDVFRIRQPELEELPIGFGGILVLLEKLMTVYTDAPETDDDEPEVTPARPTRAASRRSSNGSSASKKPATGARKNGARSAGGN